MRLKKYLINVLEKTAKIYSFFVLYCSVIIPIFFPMFIIGGFFIILRYIYPISWYLADPTCTNPNSCWLNSYLHSPFFFSKNWIYLMIIIFIIGLIFFIISLGNLVIGIRKKAGLVQERIYKHIKHPQNLCIIIMAFPLFLVNGFPIFLVGGFRLGDFVSWIQFIFLMIIYSDIGDIKLNKKYPREFQLYYKNTGFFLPRIIPYRITYYFSAIYNKKFRYVFLLSIYILCIYVIYQLFLFLPFYWLTI